MIGADVSSDKSSSTEAIHDHEDQSEQEEHSESSTEPDVKHACRHMLEGPLKSLIPLQGSGANQMVLIPAFTVS